MTEMTDENQSKTFSEDYVKELRAEAAQYRVKLRETETQFEEYKNGVSAKEAENTTKDILQYAKDAGAVDPHTVLQLLDKDSLNAEDADIKSLVQGVLEAKPFLKGGKVGQSSNPANNANTKVFTRAEVDKMSADQVNANWNDIQEQMSQGLIK